MMMVLADGSVGLADMPGLLKRQVVGDFINRTSL